MHDQLGSHWLLKDVPPIARELVCEKGVPVEVNPGEVLIHETDANRHLFLVLDGKLKVSRPQNSNRQRGLMLGFAVPGDLLGEYSFIDGSPASATVVAEERSLLYRFSHSSLQKLFATEPSVGFVIYRNLLRYLVGRLRESDDELDSIFLL